MRKTPKGLFPRLWIRFSRLVVHVFYHRFEVRGLEHLAQDQGVLLCANHTNALADALVLQAASPRLLHPLARSGLFDKPLLSAALNRLQAVPIYRRQDAGSDTQRNQDAFSRCYEMLARNEVLLIFPEGQSHSDPSLREIKTGAARIALGALDANGQAPDLLPVGLTFSHKGQFRGDALVEFGAPIKTAREGDEEETDAVLRITASLGRGMEQVTLNADSWQEIDLARRLERFFALRGERFRKGSLHHRFRALKRLLRAQRRLRSKAPGEVSRLLLHLKHFEKICSHCGVRDYQLNLRYDPLTVSWFVVRTLLLLFLALPLALWGFLNSILPYLLTGLITDRLAKGMDQYETAKILIGLALFSLFWGIQTTVVYYRFDTLQAVLYLLSLPITAAVALFMHRERRRIRENLRVFFLFLRRRDLKRYLMEKRRQLEKELAQLVRLTKKLSR